MNSPVVLDTNVLALLVVGASSRDYIKQHKRLASDFGPYEFDLLVEMIGMFSEIILIPHIVAETSSLVRQIANPARARIQNTLNNLIDTTVEYPVASAFGVRREEAEEFGITVSVILHFLSLAELNPTLFSIDEPLLNKASSLGYSVVNCRSEFWTGRY
jgi:hypothetical protein